MNAVVTKLVWWTPGKPHCDNVVELYSTCLPAKCQLYNKWLARGGRTSLVCQMSLGPELLQMYFCNSFFLLHHRHASNMGLIAMYFKTVTKFPLLLPLDCT